MSQFLLPCNCGAKIPVNRSQAGMTLPCTQCGQSIDVPTIRKLAPYASAPAAKTVSKKVGNSWNFLGFIAAIGFLVGLVGLAYSGNLAYERFSTISRATKSGMDLSKTEEDFVAGTRQNALNSAPSDTWDYWNIMIEDGLSDPQLPHLFQVKRYLASRLPTLYTSLAIGSVGMLIFAVSSFLMQSLKRKAMIHPT